MTVSVSLHGFAGASADLRRLKTSVPKAVRPVVASRARSLRSKIRAATPVDTGELRGSVEASIASDGLTAVVSTDHEIARLIEFGGLRTRAQPYFLGTAASQAGATRSALIAAVGKALK